MIIIMMLIGAVLVYMALQFIYGRLWNKNLTADVHFNVDHAVKGDVIEINEVITNMKRLPIPYINVKFQVDRNLDFGYSDGNAKMTDMSYRNDIFSLLFYQRVTRKIPVTCKRRGVYKIDNVELISAGIFMNDVLQTSINANTQVTVYPDVADISRLMVPFHKIMGTIERNRHIYEDKFVFRGIRDYESYDPMNSVNWKASARAGSLMVNQYNETMCQEVCILLNFEPEGMLLDDRVVEESISIAAGFAQMFIEQGVQTSMLTNGTESETGEIANIDAASGFAHLNMVNTVLARLQVSKNMYDFTEQLELINGANDIQKLYIMISANTRTHLQEAFSNINGNEQSVWITPRLMSSESKKVTLDYCNAEIIEWEVDYNVK